MKKTTLIVILPLVLLFIVSCQKQEADNETQSIIDFCSLQREFIGIASTVNYYASSNSAVKKVSASCETVTVSGDTTFTSSGNPPVITINYGGGCTAADGSLRSGIIQSSFSKSFDSSGCVVSISFNSFSVNGNSLSGAIELVRTTSNSFTMKVTAGKLTVNGAELTFDCEESIVFSSNNTPLVESDDSAEVSGTAAGTSREKRYYTAIISANLKKSAGCRFIDKGSVTLAPKDLAARQLDFGDGSCDQRAVFTVTGNKFEFTLP